jgi:arsenate reductase
VRGTPREVISHLEEADLPLVLFVCVHNSARSQMAEGFARELGRGVLRAASAGTVPGKEVHPLALLAMKERGIDIFLQRPRTIDLEEARSAARLISMGCGVEEACPAVLFERMEDWALDDPAKGGIAEFRRARDDIEERVRSLVAETRSRTPSGHGGGPRHAATP